MALQATREGGDTIVTPRTTPTTTSAGQDPVAAPAPTPNQDITVGATPGFTPDYNAAIQGDPGYLAAKNSVGQADAQSAAQRQAALRAMVTRYGALPAGFTDTYGDIDQATLDAAKGNQYSTLAQIRDGYNKSLESFRRGLAARGMVGSGDENYGTGQLDQGYGQQQYDAANSFLGQENDALSGYLGQVSNGRTALANAISQAEANQYANPANQPTEGTAGRQAHLRSDLTSQYGTAVYEAPDEPGVYYDQYGNSWTPPSSSADTDRFGNARTPGAQF